MKYGNKKITYNGMTFDSKKEFERYIILVGYERSGLITDLRRQVVYELIPMQYEAAEGENSRRTLRLAERAVKYKADFVYHDVRANKDVVEDVKGLRTREYIIKRKLMLYRHGLKITEV